MTQINLGDKVRDNVTGLTGQVQVVSDWLYGCRRIGVQPYELSKDGIPVDVEWFDEPRLELVVAELPKVSVPTGGPARSEDPGRKDE